MGKAVKKDTGFFGRMSAAEFQQLARGKGKKSKAVKGFVTGAKWDAQRVEGGVKITVPEELPSLNEWKNWNPFKYNAEKDRFVEALQQLRYILNEPAPERAKLQYVFYRRTDRTRDDGNFSDVKYVTDALQYAGWLLGDDTERLDLVKPEFILDKVNPRTEIIITYLESR